MMNLYKYRETLIKARLLRSLALNLVISILVFVILPQNLPFLILYEFFLLKTFYLSARNLDHFDVLTFMINSLCYILVTHNLFSSYNTAIIFVAIIYNIVNLSLFSTLLLVSNISPNFKLNNNVTKYNFPYNSSHYAWYMENIPGLDYTVYDITRQYHHVNRVYLAFIIKLPVKLVSDINYIQIANNDVRAIIQNKNPINSLVDYFYPKKDTFKLLHTDSNDPCITINKRITGFTSAIFEKNASNEVLRIIIYAADAYDFNDCFKIIYMILENERNFKRREMDEKDFQIH